MTCEELFSIFNNLVSELSKSFISRVGINGVEPRIEFRIENDIARMVIIKMLNEHFSDKLNYSEEESQKDILLEDEERSGWVIFDKDRKYENSLSRILGAGKLYNIELFFKDVGAFYQDLVKGEIPCHLDAISEAVEELKSIEMSAEKGKRKAQNTEDSKQNKNSPEKYPKRELKRTRNVPKRYEGFAQNQYELSELLKDQPPRKMKAASSETEQLTIEEQSTPKYVSDEETLEIFINWYEKNRAEFESKPPLAIAPDKIYRGDSFGEVMALLRVIRSLDRECPAGRKFCDVELINWLKEKDPETGSEVYFLGRTINAKNVHKMQVSGGKWEDWINYLDAINQCAQDRSKLWRPNPAEELVGATAACLEGSVIIDLPNVGFRPKTLTNGKKEERRTVTERWDIPSSVIDVVKATYVCISPESNASLSL